AAVAQDRAMGAEFALESVFRRLELAFGAVQCRVDVGDLAPVGAMLRIERTARARGGTHSHLQRLDLAPHGLVALAWVGGAAAVATAPAVAPVLAARAAQRPVEIAQLGFGVEVLRQGRLVAVDLRMPEAPAAQVGELLLAAG